VKTSKYLALLLLLVACKGASGYHSEFQLWVFGADSAFTATTYLWKGYALIGSRNTEVLPLHALDSVKRSEQAWADSTLATLRRSDPH
jgi:hypothetical protein